MHFFLPPKMEAAKPGGLLKPLSRLIIIEARISRERGKDEREHYDTAFLTPLLFFSRTMSNVIETLYMKPLM